ncbi:phosphatase PAP2 family protein [Nonlabens ponticola]|uniref:Phosphatase PAP2 family protein n=1 Tax=Nonlabens ponticola TaxID=2496866 RepID=A0A3S9MUJ9_9FLAO|nr:phosphatase PAP2 family protein [Nonlabens ponticola]AZQ42854.1 phosphatase PAP2 family protein [Nonlabens ponticola]
MWESLVQIDQDIFRFINGLPISRFNEFWLFVTQIENWIPLYLLFFFILIYKLRWRRGLASILGVFTVASVTLWLTNVVKDQVQRLRPNNEPALVDAINVFQMPENFSFWSGHSAVSFAVTTFVVLLLRKYSWSRWYLLFYLWPLTFALSRIMVGVHYPFDVIVGMLVGLLLGILFYKAMVAIFQKLQHST